MFSSTLEDRLTYVADDCFVNFPFPIQERLIQLSDNAAEYLKVREETMKTEQIGYTDFMNRFHDPNDIGIQMVRFRNAHVALSEAVKNAYGWHDIDLDYEFYEDYSDSDKRVMRYRVSDGSVDKIIGKLLH